MVNYMSEESTFRALLLKSSRLFTDQINLVLQAYDLNYSLWQVLYVIECSKQCTLIDIAQHLNISQPAISKRIFTLEQQQLILIIPSQNRREKIVTLSNIGLQQYQICRQQIVKLEEKYLKHIPDNDIVITKQVLQQFLTNLHTLDESYE